MSEREEYIQEYQEMLDYEENTPVLCKYIDMFLRYNKIVREQEDGRVLLYRGQSNKKHSLNPSVFRRGLLAKEHIMIQDMLLKAPDDFINVKNAFERLVKMQHYGLPTRLLDATTNPLVAIYFSCEADSDKDGEIFIFYDYIKNPQNIIVQNIVSMAEYSGSSERQMLGFLTERGFAHPELGSLTKITHLLIEAPLNNERIRRQHGAFVLVGIHGEEIGNPYQKASFDLRPLLVKDFGDGISRSIVIPKEEKKQLLIELDVLGINNAFLFPELEHQAKSIRVKHEEA